MTTTYDPHHPAYTDEADLREELTRVYDLCHGCRLCFKFCPAFPSLFEMVDANDGEVDQLTPAEQDRVVDECYQCKLCYVNCPYTPPHEWQLDFPRLMLRAQAVRHEKSGIKPADEFLGRTDLVGRLSTAGSPVVNRLSGAPGSLSRRLMEKTVGIAADRLLPPYARQRFSTWWKHRVKPLITRRQGEVALFPTCLVEYQDPAIGHDTVKVYERNGVECTLPEGQVCCGMPWLDGGDTAHFEEQGRTNVAILAEEVRRGRDIVVPQPTCAYVLRHEYPAYLKSDDAALVAEHTFDPAEYLWKLHQADHTELDVDFPGEVPEEVTYHVACHLRAQQIGFKARDLMQLMGTEVTLANTCSGIDGTWGYKKENYEMARDIAAGLRDEITEAGNDTVVGDCHLANWSITQETGDRPVHPMQLLARAYGIPPEPDAQKG